MNVTENDPVQWGRSNLAWTPEGYKLRLTIWLDQRGSALFASKVGDTLAGFQDLEGAEARWIPGSITHDAKSTEAEPGELEITADRVLFAIAPADFRRAVTDLALACRREGDEQQARDEELAAEWLTQLRAAD